MKKMLALAALAAAVVLAGCQSAAEEPKPGADASAAPSPSTPTNTPSLD